MLNTGSSLWGAKCSSGAKVFNFLALGFLNDFFVTFILLPILGLARSTARTYLRLKREREESVNAISTPVSTVFCQNTTVAEKMPFTWAKTLSFLYAGMTKTKLMFSHLPHVFYLTHTKRIRYLLLKCSNIPSV